MKIHFKCCRYYEREGLDTRAMKERLAEIVAEEEAAKVQYEQQEKELSNLYVKQWKNKNSFVF